MPILDVFKSRKRKINSLIALLDHKEESVREAAIEEIVEKGDAEIVKLLLRACEHGTWRYRYAMSGALVLIGKPAVNELIVALKDKSPEIRDSSASALGLIGDERAVDPLLDALESDSHVQNRVRIIEALYALNYKNIDQLLLTSLNDNEFCESEHGHNYVSSFAVELLGKMGGESVIGPLSQILMDKRNRHLHTQVTGILSKIGDERVIEGLILALKGVADHVYAPDDHNYFVDPRSIHEDACKGLVRLTKEDFGTDLNKWLEWWEKSSTQS